MEQKEYTEYKSVNIGMPNYREDNGCFASNNAASDIWYN